MLRLFKDFEFGYRSLGVPAIYLRLVGLQETQVGSRNRTQHPHAEAHITKQDRDCRISSNDHRRCVHLNFNEQIYCGYIWNNDYKFIDCQRRKFLGIKIYRLADLHRNPMIFLFFYFIITFSYCYICYIPKGKKCMIGYLHSVRKLFPHFVFGEMTNFVISRFTNSIIDDVTSEKTHFHTLIRFLKNGTFQFL